MRSLKWVVIGSTLGALAIAAPAHAATTTTTVGQLFTPTYGCSGPNTYLQTGVADGNSYVIPKDGVITSWSFQAGATPVTGLKLKVGHTTTNGYLIDAEAVAGTQTPNAVNTYSANIPVVAGQTIGLHQNGGNCALQTSSALDDVVYSPGDIAPGGELTGSFEGFRFPISAVVTSVSPDPPPDTDAPETTITKGAPNRTEKSKVKFKFTSDEASASFECKTDRKPFKPCTSPKVVKRLDDGKHKFTVRAIDSAGNVDATPAKDRFRVLD